jgi:DNA-binding transcriptional LysR family regulator
MTRWPDLAALEILVAVADHGSLGAGARACGMDQPNASRSLARLERRLDLQLLVRSTTGSSLTPSGTVVVEWARETLGAAQALVDGAAGLTSSEAGSLVVAASQTVAEHLLPTWLVRLHEARPRTAVRVAVHNSAEVLADVLHGRCALGFVEDPATPRGVHHVVVDRDELVAVVAASHRWARRRRPLRPDEIVSAGLVTREPGSGTRVALDRALGPAGPARPGLELSSNAAIRASVAAGSGVAVLSRLAVGDALESGVLVEVPVAELDLRRRLRAVWTGPRRLTGAAADLVAIARRPRRRPSSGGRGARGRGSAEAG